MREQMRADSAQVVESTVGLVSYLRELVRSGRKTVLDVRSYQRVEWLGELPPGIAVRRPPADGAVPDNLLLRVGFEAQSKAPEPPPMLAALLDAKRVQDPEGPVPVLRETAEERGPGSAGSELARRSVSDEARAAELRAQYARWSESWRAWAAREAPVRARQKVYKRLLSLARLLSQQDDVLEAVLAVGLVSWRPVPGARVNRHLVTRRLRISVDRVTARVDVRLDPEAVLRLEDRDFLHELPGYGEERIAAIHDALPGADQHPLSSQTVELLEDWRRLAFDRASRLDHEWTRPEPGGEAEEAVVSLSPAIILRKRDRNAWVEYYDRIESALTGPDPLVPLGLAQLVVPLDAEERAAWGTPFGSAAEASPPALGADPLFPLPTNPEQRGILRRLEAETCVVVQGPPGTGKTHTIANLVSALLARGQRVLVTSQKDQALRVLREKLPEEIQQLCVLMTTRAKGGASSDLEQTLTSFADHLSRSALDEPLERIAELEDRRLQVRQRIAVTEERVRLLRVAETVEHEEVAPGYSGSFSALSEALRRDRGRLDWLPRPVPDGAEDLLPDLERLRDLIRSATPERAASLGEWLPPADRVLSAGDFLRHAEKLRALRELDAQPAREEWTEQLARLDEPTTGELERQLGLANAAVYELGLEQDPANWPAGDWRTRLLEDTLARRRGTLWQRAADISARIRRDQTALARLGPGGAVLPTLQRAELEAFRANAQSWAAHLAENGRRSKRSVKDLRRQIEPLLAQCQVNGRIPDDPAAIGVVLAHLDATLTLEYVAAAYADVEVSQPGGSLSARQDEYNARAELFEPARRFGDAARQAGAALASHGVHILLDTPRQWHRFGSALRECRAHAERLRLEEAFEALAEELYQAAGSQGSATSLPRLVLAIRSCDAEEYAAVVAVLDRIRQDQAEETQCRALSLELARAYPALARLLTSTATDSRWDDLGAIRAALAWARAADFVESREPAGIEQALNAELLEAEQSLREVTAQLAAAQAWWHCEERMTQAQRSALQAFRLAVARIGKGTGAYAGKGRAAARSAMAVARSAVPAWVMPINQVVEMIPALPDLFDVVIVDEASQVGIEALFLQWLAPRVVIVGDDRQCVPGFGGRGVHETHFARLEELLPDMPVHLRDGLRPGNSLYEMMTTMAPLPVRLGEHFRCMPEIIGWSSRQFYEGALDPVRQFGADRLEPLKVVRVDGGYTEGSNSDIRNPVEAKRIIEQLRELFDDPAYLNRTFGVITLQGTGQARLLTNMIEDSFEQAEIERHELRVGVPADFQGDERDVVLLSMIVTDPPVARTSRDDQRRYNVAASRAKDQMWLFVSVDPTRLKEDDLRSSLLRYMQSPPPALPVLGADLADVRPDARHHPFDSLFEQRVFLRIRERGFLALPQFPAGGRSIDLVVIGANGRLAVECDGTYWHSGQDRQREDLRRERELVRVGWKFWRVRESSFTLDPDAALEPLWDRLAELGIEPVDAVAGVAPSAVAGVPEWSPIALSEQDAGSDDDQEQDAQEGAWA